MDSPAELTAKFRSVWPLLDERTRRIMAASEAMALGYGGTSLVRRACGLSRKAIAKGIREIAEGAVLVEGRIRRPGGGRKPIMVSDPRLVGTLEAMIDDQTRGVRNRPCGGFVRVRGRLRRSWVGRNIRSAMPRSPRFFTDSITACRATGRPRRGETTRTATRSFGTSMPP
jgi:hypothetical protein